jgi:hypothetical protein
MLIAMGQNTYTLFTVVSLSGIFGGILYGMKDKRIELPYKKSKHIIVPGLFLDILFGLAGGFIIFMIVPGEFDVYSGEFEFMKVISVAILGGYGGRALVEKVFEQQIQKLEEDIEGIQVQSQNDTLTEASLIQHLDDDPDTPLVSKTELKKNILKSSSRIKLLAFNMARDYRKNTGPSELEKIIPIFEALILADEERKYHRNHAQLGYIYKDKKNPSYSIAENHFTMAINIRNAMSVVGFRLYEYNRAICRILLEFDRESIQSDLDEAIKDPKVAKWVQYPSTDGDIIIQKWMRENMKG